MEATCFLQTKQITGTTSVRQIDRAVEISTSLCDNKCEIIFQKADVRRFENNVIVSGRFADKEKGRVVFMKETRIDIYKGAWDLKVKPYEHHVKYYETDQMGIVHHSNYIRWMEEARMDFMEQMGCSYKAMEAAEIISPVLSVHCEYKSMVHFSDTVVIETKISKYDSVKLAVLYRMTDKETGELRTIAKSEHCFLDGTGKPISLKRAYPEIDTKFFDMMDED